MTTYLFDSDRLYKHNDPCYPPPLIVEPLTLVCYNVRGAGGNAFASHTWEFQVEGKGDTWFTTSYNWALVLNTPENLEAIRHRNTLRAERADAVLRSARANDLVINASSMRIKG